MQTAEDQEPAIFLAQQLMRQIDQNHPKTGVWMISILFKLASADEKMPVTEVLEMARQNMPKRWEDWCHYLKHT